MDAAGGTEAAGPSRTATDVPVLWGYGIPFIDIPTVAPYHRQRERTLNE